MTCVASEPWDFNTWVAFWSLIGCWLAVAWLVWYTYNGYDLR